MASAETRDRVQKLLLIRCITLEVLVRICQLLCTCCGIFVHLRHGVFGVSLLSTDDLSVTT